MAITLYNACAQSVFCRLGKGMTDLAAVRWLLVENGYDGWRTAEQDCDPVRSTSPVADGFE